MKKTAKQIAREILNKVADEVTPPAKSKEKPIPPLSSLVKKPSAESAKTSPMLAAVGNTAQAAGRSGQSVLGAGTPASAKPVTGLLAKKDGK